MARLAQHHRDTFGVDPPPDPPPIRAAMPPQQLGYVRPLVVEHLATCHGDAGRVETTGYDNGLRIARCTDCLATRQVRAAP